MKPYTLTELQDLRPGDIFRLAAGDGRKLIKSPADPFRKNKKIFLYATHEGELIPVALRKKTKVIFIKRSKQLVL